MTRGASGVAGDHAHGLDRPDPEVRDVKVDWNGEVDNVIDAWDDVGELILLVKNLAVKNRVARRAPPDDRAKPNRPGRVRSKHVIEPSSQQLASM